MECEIDDRWCLLFAVVGVRTCGTAKLVTMPVVALQVVSTDDSLKDARVDPEARFEDATLFDYKYID